MRHLRMVIGIAALAAVPMASRAAPAPDPGAIARLQTEAMKMSRFRVDTRMGQFMVGSLRIDAERGVMIRDVQSRPALIVTSETDPGEKRWATWAEIERIDGQRPHGGQGALIGGAVGGLLGLALYGWVSHNYDNVDAAIFAVPLGAGAGALVGAGIGSTAGWRPIFP